MIARYGDRAVLIDVADSAAAQELASRLRGGEGILDVIPAARSVVVTFLTPPGEDEFALLTDRLSTRQVATRDLSQRLVEIPVIYDGEDLASVAAVTGLSPAQVAQLHSSVTYRAAFAGFAPGFVYLEGLPEILHLPRRSSPRTSVPRGALAMAAHYTAIYPRSSPGGWHLIGHTQVEMFDPSNERPAVIEPGDTVRFVRMDP